MIVYEGNEAIQLPRYSHEYIGKELIITNESKKPLYIMGTGCSLEANQKVYFAPDNSNGWALIGFDGV